MNKLVIYRDSDNGTQTTGHGVVVPDGDADAKPKFTFFTLELPWKNNERGVSCIPPGVYTIRRREPHGNFPYKHFDILNTTPREGVKIHAGNYCYQIRGCQLVGSALIDINGDGQKDVTNSKDTLKNIVGLLPYETTLEIISPCVQE